MKKSETRTSRARTSSEIKTSEIRATDPRTSGGNLFIVSAPSGAGKNTLVENFLKNHSSIYKESFSLKRAITYTSKKPRLGDIDGKDYHFISETEFKEKIQEGFFLEYSTAYGSYYGTPCLLLEELELGGSFFLIIDKAGAQNLSQLYKDHILIWIAPSSIEELEERLIKRAGESVEDIQKRLALARLEMAEEKDKPFYHHYITNMSVEQGVEQLKEIVFQYFK